MTTTQAGLRDQGTYNYACQKDEVLKHIGKDGWKAWVKGVNSWLKLYDHPGPIDLERIQYFLLSRGPGERLINVVAHGPELPKVGICYPVDWVLRSLPAPDADVAEPKRIMQTEFGPHGNCQSACLAMMLGFELSEVPNFASIDGSNNEKYRAQGAWLHENGLWLMTVVKWQALPWPPSHGYYIAGGTSPRGYRHSVIFKDGNLWHDPHPDGTGIGEVEDVDLLLPLGFNPSLHRLSAENASLKAELAARNETVKWLHKFRFLNDIVTIRSVLIKLGASLISPTTWNPDAPDRPRPMEDPREEEME